jgi:hypothetical protein
MSNNHLIIGLGGTGGNIIRSFRKKVYQDCGSDLAPNVNIRYLYIDSDESEMKPNLQSWTILGHSVELPVISQLPLSGLDLKDVIENPSKYRSIRPWIGNRSDWTDILNSVDASRVVASQKRRLGRFLFAPNVGEFRKKITGFVSEMEKDNSRTISSLTGATFHVCCGLAGGTGSGILVDVISQIRAAHPGKDYRIVVYAQLPERAPEGDRARENYHANGYAALMELNALAVNSWRPHDLLATDGQRLDIKDPFNCCYMFSDENEANVAVAVKELPEIVASFLFQKIVQLRAPNVDWGTAGDAVQRMETFENKSAGIESELSPPPRCEPRRTRRFLSFGVKQIAYPEVEIREYLTYSFAQQAALQLLYNNWVDGNGYQEEQAAFDFEEFVAKPERQEHWYLDDQHLTLSRGILKSEIDSKAWKPIADFWKAVVPGLMLHVLDQHKGSVVKMMPELNKLCETAYSEQYRGNGVQSFYKTKLGDMGDHVRELRQRIEVDLFTDWRNGARSIHDTDRLLGSLTRSLSAKLQNIDLSISKLSETSDLYALNERKYRDNNLAWSNLGPLSIAIGKHKKILSAQTEVLVARYTMKTQMEGYIYARKLVESLLHELSSLSANIGYCKAMIVEAIAAFRIAMNSRLADAGNKDIGKQVVRQYDPAAVREFVRDLSRDKREQEKQAGEVRERLVDMLKGKLTFANLAQAVPGNAFQNALSESCMRSAVSAHADAIARDRNRGILKVSLIELLNREFGGNDTGLRQYARDIMEKARNYLKLANSEKVSGDDTGNPSANNAESGICTTCSIIVAPEAPEAADFREKFCAALKESTKHIDSMVVTNKSRDQEITIVTLTHVFPARFAELVDLLRTKYQARIKAGGKRAFLELHSEGEGPEIAAGQELFDLFPETYKPVDILPWIMLAQGMGLIVPDKDPDTGRDMFVLTATDKDGLPDNRPLGANLAAVIENADSGVMEDLKLNIRKRLTCEYLHIDKRKLIDAAIVARVRITAETTSANSQMYKQEREALSSIRKILEIEA